MNKIYLDYAATTPVDPRVLRAMQPYFSDTFGNPSSLHSFGQQAVAAVDASRESIAGAFKADFRETIFTGSATEANNLALRGVVRGTSNFQFPRLRRDFGGQAISKKKLRIIISAIEHESVRETARDLAREGIEVVEIPVDRRGIIDLKKLEAALNERTVLVSVIYANNEIGTVQPIAEISKLLRNFRDGSRIKNQGSRWPLFHTDAAQAFQFLPCIPLELGVDLMTISAHKIYGPKGIGALYLKNQKSKIKNNGSSCVAPILTGGGQEFGLRSGTENVPLIVGLAKAAELVNGVRGKEAPRIRRIRDYFWGKLKEIDPQAELVVPCVSESQASSSENEFLPNILNVYFPGQSAEQLITRLDLLGVAVSSGSACHARASQPSYVLEALGFSKEKAQHCIRFSFGRQTTQAHISLALKKITAALARNRRIAMK